MDGTEELNNILVIGMTNRLHLIDKALLRDGRFELHIEVGLPNRDGRREIFLIHTKEMRDNNKLHPDVMSNLDRYIDIMRNFTGADIASVIQNAQTYAFAQLTDPFGNTESINSEEIVVTHEHKMAAISETHPIFGSDTRVINNILPENFQWKDDNIHNVYNQVVQMMTEFVDNDASYIQSVLLTGLDQRCDSSIICAKIAEVSPFPCVKYVAADEFIGMVDHNAASHLKEYFEEVYKSESSLIILDNIEDIICYSPIGPRYNNDTLRSLGVMVTKKPPNRRKIFIVATSASSLSMLNIPNKFTEYFQC
jgi:vesicle-fusing ATPase